MGLNKYKGFVAGDILPAENTNSINPDSLVAQADAILTGGTSPSALSVFYALALGANNGKFKITIDGTTYDNVAINLANAVSAGANIEQTSQDNHEHPTSTRFISQSFLTGANTVRAVNIQLYCGGGPNNGDIFSVHIYACDVNDKPTGSALATDTVSPSLGDPAYIDYTITCELSPATKYCIVVKGRSGTDSTGLFYKGTASSYANGKLAVSTDSGGTWTVDATKDLLFVITTYDYTYPSIASLIQTAIRALTSKLETCIWSTNKFIITGNKSDRAGSILKLLTPTAGTDISGVNATRYLDLGTNATETAGTGEEYNLQRLDQFGGVSNLFISSETGATGFNGTIPDGCSRIYVQFYHQEGHYLQGQLYLDRHILTATMQVYGSNNWVSYTADFTTKVLTLSCPSYNVFSATIYYYR